MPPHPRSRLMRRRRSLPAAFPRLSPARRAHPSPPPRPATPPSVDMYGYNPNQPPADHYAAAPGYPPAAAAPGYPPAAAAAPGAYDYGQPQYAGGYGAPGAGYGGAGPPRYGPGNRFAAVRLRGLPFGVHEADVNMFLVGGGGEGAAGGRQGARDACATLACCAPPTRRVSTPPMCSWCTSARAACRRFGGGAPPSPEQARSLPRRAGRFSGEAFVVLCHPADLDVAMRCGGGGAERRRASSGWVMLLLRTARAPPRHHARTGGTAPTWATATSRCLRPGRWCGGGGGALRRGARGARSSQEPAPIEQDYYRAIAEQFAGGERSPGRCGLAGHRLQRAGSVRAREDPPPPPLAHMAARRARSRSPVPRGDGTDGPASFVAALNGSTMLKLRGLPFSGERPSVRVVGGGAGPPPPLLLSGDPPAAGTHARSHRPRRHPVL